MGLKFWIKNIWYGASRCSREEIIRVLESVRWDLHASKRELYQELRHLKRETAAGRKKIKLLQEQNQKNLSLLQEQNQKNLSLLQEQNQKNLSLLQEQNQSNLAFMQKQNEKQTSLQQQNEKQMSLLQQNEKDMALLAEQNKNILKLTEQLFEIIQEQSTDDPEQKIHTHIDMVQRDIMLALKQKGSFLPGQKAKVSTQYPVAVKSNDHLYPRGTKHDNTRAPHFITKCEQLLGQNLKFLDLGCSGGGLVLDGILKGHFAVGLEGSDYSQKMQRAEWRLLKDYLFTCDITKPFEIQDASTGEQIVFDIISAWEVLEHIREEDLPALLGNISLHLSDSGYFVGTMSQAEDQVDGVVYHQTIRDYKWWKEVFEKHGFEVVEGLFEKEDLARGNGNPPNCWMLDWGSEDSQFLAARKNQKTAEIQVVYHA